MQRMQWMSAAMAIMALAVTTTVPAKAVELETTKVEQSTIDDRRVFEGTVEAVNKATVSAQTMGRILSIEFDVDDYVRAGEVILRFEDTEHKARLVQAESALNAATSQLENQKSEFSRAKKLYANGTIAKARFDAIEAAFNAAKANEQSAKAAVTQAREQLGYTVVRAPFSGFVVKRHVQIGEIAGIGKPLMTGFSLEKLRVKVDVPQAVAARVRANAKADIVVADGTTIQSTSLVVFPFADPRTNTVTVRISLPKAIKVVFPGMLVKAAFVIGNQEQVTIAGEAVVRRGEVTGAYLVGKNQKISFIPIRVGRTLSDGNVEVLSGLKVGDTVATDPLKAAFEATKQRAKNK